MESFVKTLFITENPFKTAPISAIVPKKFTLIACPWTFYDHVEFRSQQLGLGYVGAYAQQFGHEIVGYIDPMVGGGEEVKVSLQTKYMQTNRFGLPDEEIARRIPRETEVIGINAPFTDSRLVLYPLIRAIKNAFPQALIVVGGVLATTLPRQIMENCPADVVVKGEGEIAFARILNDEPFKNIPGILFRTSEGAVCENPGRSEQLLTMDKIPPPGYNFRPMAEYVRWSPRGNKTDRTLSLISSRGCPFTCEFCSIPEKGQRWRPFTPERVLDEVKTAIEQWGVNHIEFEDDNFTLQEPRALKVLSYLRELRYKGYPMSCSFPNGIMIDRMSKNLAVLMAEAGAEVAYLPVESGDPRVLAAMDKPNAEGHLEKTLEVASYCVEAGLFVSCFFINAYPGGEITHRSKFQNHPEWERYYIRDGNRVFLLGEDEESYEKTRHFCGKLRELGVHGITPLIATPYPGTELYYFCEKFGYLAYPDDKDVLVTVSYANVKPENVQIETPWCSRKRAYERWKFLMDNFPTYHNVRKLAVEDKAILSGEEIREKS